MKRTITILMILALIIGTLPGIIADDENNNGKENNKEKGQVRAGMPIVFSVSNREDTNDNEDDSDESTNDNSEDEGDDSQGSVSSGSGNSGSSGSGRQVTARQVVSTAQNTNIENQGIGNQVRNMVKSRINVSELMNELPEQQQTVFNNMLRAQKEKILEMNISEAVKEMNKYQLRPVDKDTMYKKRVVAQEQVQEAAKNYGQAVSNYAKLNSIYKDKRQAFLEVKNQLRNCTSIDNEECNELRDAALERAKEYLINGADMVIQHLNKILSRTEGSEQIEEDEAEKIIEDVKGTIVQLEKAIEQVKAAETKDEVQQAAKEINQAWERIKHKERLYAAKLVNAQVWNILRRSENLESRLDNILSEMEEQEINVTNIEEELDLFSEYVFDAKNKYNNATDLLEEARDLLSEDGKADVSEITEEAKEWLRKAHDDLKEAHSILIDIILKIREAGGEISDESELDENDLYEVVEGETEDEEDNDENKGDEE
jgi:hypothetical protein